MRSSNGRRPGKYSRGGETNRGKSWLVLCAFATLALLWVCVAVFLLPGELEKISTGVSPHHEAGRAGSPPGMRGRLPGGQVYAQRNQVPKHRDKITLEKIIKNMETFLGDLQALIKNLPPKASAEKIWEIYVTAADKWLSPMDREYKGRTLFKVKDDKSIFVSLASYRDENCPTTLQEMFSKADHPNKIFVGLVQQNCEKDCKTGVLEGGIVQDMEPDIDCYKTFCATELGAPYCANKHVRNFPLDEANSLGPAVARYFASKLWHGETFFLQIDAHSLFRKSWDTVYVQDIMKTPSYPKSVLSHYPPDTKVNNYWEEPGYRICGGIFATSSVEYQIIRLMPGMVHDTKIPEKPCPAPFIGAGFFFAHASFLADVPFDPYVPWVFMGEEILLSLRFWTWGYDIYSPSQNVLSHFYVRRHTPKFWETVNRLFQNNAIHNQITRLLIHRVKYIAGYPESSAEIINSTVPSLLTDIDLYGDGPVRAMEDYMALVGLDMTAKRAKHIGWCYKCQAPYHV